ncbi:Chemotaxis protein methyltransferase CheR [Caenispirillum salinarum AK4]|uniref:protein-glutamate O-methyltransferase n=1 Tax=Caenispirillum salinarum AK4 TaxID=1238182 RepID=K9GWQ9_9PROT|nr:chemotaxis protein CheB [Caenispirillum salinarum]EKV30440.1 Chemotaxis protein methyltransferase CheR [Caenispirillum salinarum AK4]
MPDDKVPETTDEAPEAAEAQTSRRGRRRKVTVVGIAASAGGLEALGHLVTHLPADSTMAYVVVQHMAPQHPSMLAQLLARQTDLKVVEITDGMRVEPNVIHITPPNTDLDIEDGTLSLREPHAAIGPKPSADYFFASLAEDQGENAIGIILSGTGSDGAHGVRAVKAAGGITMAQDEDSARYAGMPRAAVETGCVDFIMTPERMGEELVELLVNPKRAQLVAEDENSDAVQKLLLMVKNRLGVDFTGYKKTTILRRIKRRMAACRSETLDDYLAYINEVPQELEALRNDILISVTSFFRDQEAYDALEKVIPDLVRDKKPGDTIRVWVPACASGEEAYSLAILLAEELGDQLANYQVQIFATDVDADALARARKALYPDAALKTMSREMLSRYFLARGGYYQVVKSVRDMIVFAKHDLIQDPPFLRIDLISCRNLLIYFNAALQQKVINIFHYALNPGKYLLLGKSETVGSATSRFHTVNKKWKLFRRLGEGRTQPREQVTSFQPRGTGTEMGGPSRQRREKDVSLNDIAMAALISTYAPPTALVDRDGRILHVHGDMQGFLQLGQGAPDLNIFSMVRKELRADARSLFSRAQQKRTELSGPTSSFMRDGEENHVRLSVRPLALSMDELYMISFEPVQPAVTAPPGDSAGTGDGDPRMQELEQELVATRENLQTVVEELETANEELQSLNEELQASNEELQSSNEELETSNEELQSTNEELTTVNEELQIKSAELASANADLENILRSVGFPLIAIDRSMRVTRFNQPAKRIFDLHPTDIGQTITSVTCKVDLPGLRDMLADVVEKGETRHDTVRSGDVSYEAQFRPFHDDMGSPTGAVLTFVEGTAVKQPTDAS